MAALVFSARLFLLRAQECWADPHLVWSLNKHKKATWRWWWNWVSWLFYVPWFSVEFKTTLYKQGSFHFLPDHRMVFWSWPKIGIYFIFHDPDLDLVSCAGYLSAGSWGELTGEIWEVVRSEEIYCQAFWYMASFASGLRLYTSWYNKRFLRYTGLGKATTESS